MAALAWGRTPADLEVDKTPQLLMAVAHTVGDNGFVIDVTVETTDADFNAKSLICKFVGTIAIVNNKLTLTAVPHYWDDAPAYTSATNPAASTRDSVGGTITLTNVPNLDAIWSAAGFARTNPA